MENQKFRHREKTIICLMTVLIVALSGVSFGLYSQNLSYQKEVNDLKIQNTLEQLQTGGYFIIEIKDLNGLTTFQYMTHNVVTLIGLRHVRNLLCALNATYSTVNNITKGLSLSDDASPVNTWTKLPNEITINGLDRHTGTVTVINNTAYKTNYIFTVTGTQAIRALGLQWSSEDGSDNNLCACASFPPQTVLATNTVNMTYIINVTTP